MKTVDIFSRTTNQMLQDDHLIKYGGMLVRHGFRGGIKKLDAASVWIDATEAVIEATGSFLRYCKETEITKQIRIENEKLEKILSFQLQHNKFKQQTLQKEQELSKKQGKHKLIEYNEQSQLSQKQIRIQLTILKEIHQLLMKQRSQSGTFEELIRLQVALDNCMDSTLSLLLDRTKAYDEKDSNDT